MRKLKSSLCAVLALCAAGVPSAAAQDYPDMVGVWAGYADGIVLGDPRHFEPGEGPLGGPRIAGFDLAITITHQEGRYFWGTHTGGGATEPWLGSLWSDGSGYRAVDSDGHVDGRILSDDQIENCYTHTGGTIVASCSILTRQ